MRPLPRLLAVTTDAICRSADFAERAAVLADTGPNLGLLVRAPGSTAEQHAGFAERARAVAGTAQFLVHARPELAAALGAEGVQLRAADLSPRDARSAMGAGWIGVSVHGREEADRAIAEGAEFLLAGNVFTTASHPRPARGLDWLRELCALPRPVIAIGGITPERAAEVRAAGAWGVAAISALWDAEAPGAAARLLLQPWGGAT